VDRAKVGILKQSDQVSFRGFLEDKESGALESKIRADFLGQFTDETLEWKLAHQ
jgi:hypothetical protein